MIPITVVILAVHEILSPAHARAQFFKGRALALKKILSGAQFCAHFGNISRDISGTKFHILIISTN